MKYFLLLLLIIPFLFSCSPTVENGSKFSVATWNMGEFFDSREDGNEFSGWKESDGWNDEKYKERIKKSVMYIASNFDGADVIILEEVESKDVLISLLEGGLKREGYLYYGIAQDESQLNVAFISKIKPLSVKLLFIPEARPMLSLDFLVGEERVRVIGVHLRSRLKDENQEIREEELMMLKGEIEECDYPLIILGDFNIDPILHSEEMGDGRNGDSTLLLTGDGSTARNGRMFSPYLDYASPINDGTYFYDGKWEKIDNILLNSFFFDGEGIEYCSSSIIKGADSADYSGRPIKYDKSTGKGLSDHFALKATFII